MYGTYVGIICASVSLVISKEFVDFESSLTFKSVIQDGVN